MADVEKTKPGFLARLFGRAQAEAPVVQETRQETRQDTQQNIDQVIIQEIIEGPKADQQPCPVEETVPRIDLRPVVQDVPIAKPVETVPPSPETLPQPVADVPAPFITPALVSISANTPALSEQSWWSRLTSGLARTSSSLTTGITEIFTKRKLDASAVEDLEDILIQADLGISASARIAAAVGQGRYDKTIAPEDVRGILAREISAILAPVAQPLIIDSSAKPFVILLVGVNGSGKTTTIGKLTAKFRNEGRTVLLAAGDTFRAAAIEQLKVWGERTGADVIAREQGADAAGLAFDALAQAKATKTDILMIDTAGRLQNKVGLMDELAKVVRVIRKNEPKAPHAVLLVLDATVGQNAISQVEAFRERAGVTGLVMTKLDGTARGGILVALAAKFGLPVHFIGVGEGVDDLEPFAAADFARAIAGFDERQSGEKP